MDVQLYIFINGAWKEYNPKPAAHDHTISEVTGLQTQLNSKLNLSGGTMTGPITTGSNNITGNNSSIFQAGRIIATNSNTNDHGITSKGTRANMLYLMDGATGGLAASLLDVDVKNTTTPQKRIAKIGIFGSATSGTGGTPSANYLWLSAVEGNTYNLDATLKVDAQNRVGIAIAGSGRPTQALDVGDKIRMRTATVDSDGSDIVVTKGYMLSKIPTDTNNYLTNVTGSGNGTVTFTRQGLLPLTWDATHTHAYLADNHPAAAVTSGKIINWDSAHTDTNNATNTNTVNRIVKRDASGDFSAGTITANLTGTASGNLTSSSTLNPANVSQTASYRFVTDSEKTTWHGKQTALGYTPENAANKITSIRTTATDTAYVSELGVKTYVDGLIGSVYRPAGDWNANTNSPALANNTPANAGKVYRVSTAGTRFGFTFAVGDKLAFNESGVISKWDNVDDVVSVNGQTGTVNLTASNVGARSSTWTPTWNQVTSKPDVIIEGDSRLTNARPAIDVEAWAKAPFKPSYNLGEITDGTTYKRVTESEKIAWHNKANGNEVVRATTESKNILGTAQGVFNVSEKKVWFNKGALFYGTAAAAGLVTRGISGVKTDGSAKDHLYINYDGNNTLSRQLVLGAGSTGTDRGHGIYDYSAVRGDAFIAYLTNTLGSYAKTINGAASTIASTNLLADRALISNSTGKVAVSAVTSTELGYLDGVTSSIQTQLSNKAPSTHSHGKAQITNFDNEVLALFPAWAKADNKPSYDFSEIAETTAYKRVTDLEKSTWNNKQNALGFTPENPINKRTSIRSSGANDTSYVSELGVKTYVDDAVSGKVDKDGNKVLSTNDYTTTEKNKLAGIASGAQVNVGTNLSQGARGTTTLVINSSTGNSLTLPAVTTSLAGLMTATDKTRLNALHALLEEDTENDVVDTINEVLAIFNNYPEGADLVTALAGKVDKATDKGLSTNDLTNTLKSNYDTAYGWGNHATENYLKSITKAMVEAVLKGTITTHNHDGVYEPSFTKNSAFNKNFGTTAGTVTQGNDSRLSDARPASDVSDWAKKPSLAHGDIPYATSSTKGGVRIEVVGTSVYIYTTD